LTTEIKRNYTIQLYNVKMSIELVWCCHSKIEIESIRGIKCFKIHKFRIIRTKAIDSDNDNSTKSSGQNSDSVVLHYFRSRVYFDVFYTEFLFIL